jgi:small-conductance mechanosensitive channel
MGILSFLSGIFKPATDLIDSLHTSEEERLQLRRELAKVENEFSSKVLDYHSKLMESQASIIKAEATGHSWLQQNWRPITMLVFLVLVVLDSFGILASKLAPEAWTLLQIGLGGYVVGRSAEKIITPALAGKRESEAKG